MYTCSILPSRVCGFSFTQRVVPEIRLDETNIEHTQEAAASAKWAYTGIAGMNSTAVDNYCLISWNCKYMFVMCRLVI